MARKRYEMKVDSKTSQIIMIGFFGNMLGLSLGIFTERTFHFMKNLLILYTIIPYLKFEYQRLNRIGPHLVLMIFAAIYTTFSIVKMLLSVI